MSKIGQKSITIPSSVTVNIDGKKLMVKGPQGEMFFTVPEKIEVIKKGEGLVIKRLNNEKKIASLHGLYRQLIYNAVFGVEKPWQKRLEVVGTGYTVKPQGEDLVFKIGYSHPVIFRKQPGVKLQIEGTNKVIISGCDKQLVGQVACQIKMLKKPDVYKGKGIRYEGEKIRIKPGKKAKVAGPTI